MRVTRSQLERFQRYSNVFSTDDGKWVLEDLEKYCGGECFVKGEDGRTDLYATLYNAFNRDFLERIKHMLKVIEGPLEIEEDE